MGRTFFARGSRGMIAKRIQGDLFSKGFTTLPKDKFVDGDFGGNTAAAVKALQRTALLPETGEVDAPTWSRLTPDPLPSLFERCLQWTAWLEGHGFTLAQGNFDGAGITWGLIGYTLSAGEVQKQLAQAEADEPGILLRSFGGLLPQLKAMLAMPRAQQLRWADALTLLPKSAGKLPAAWTAAFARLGEEPKVKFRQIEQAYNKYFVSAAASARALGLTSELGVALAFDVHVQNGSFKASVMAKAAQWPANHPEPNRRRDLANWVADASTNVRFREDVRARKMCIARGGGPVRGQTVNLPAWGLAEGLAA